MRSFGAREAAGGLLFATYVVILGRARLQRPDLERWQEGKEPPWDSPPLAAGIRGENTVAPRGARALREPAR